MYGLNSECDGKVWRVDVGMSSGVLNAEAQVRMSTSTPTTAVLVMLTTTFTPASVQEARGLAFQDPKPLQLTRS